MSSSAPPVYDGPLPGEERDEIKVETMALTDGAGALSAVDKASIDMQIATAKQYPRSVTKALHEALTLATVDEETAGSMFYALPRSGKNIEGPSARLAEIMAYSWGNLRVDADIVAEDRTTVTAMGTCFDLEKNVAVRVRVKRRITDKNGRRFNEDMIGVTSNAAISIALRNSVFKVIPRSMVERIYQAARKASIGKGGTMQQKRQAAASLFAKMGVTEAELFGLLNVRGWDDVGEDELILLRGTFNAIKEGESTVERIFRATGNSESADVLNAAIKQNPAETPAARAAEPAAPPAAEKKANKKPADAPEPKKCPVCFRSDGSHDPNAPCYAD